MNLQLVDVNKRWYEDEQSAAISNHSTPVSLQHLAQAPHADLQQRIIDHVQPPCPAIHRTFTKEVEKASTRSRERNSELMAESSSSSDMPTPIPNRSPLLSSQISDVEQSERAVDEKNCDVQSNANTSEADSDESNEPYFLSPDTYHLNDDVYFRRVASNLKENQFWCSLHAWKTHIEKREIFTKADPYIDVSYLIRGMVRPVFDLERFVEKYPNLQQHLFELR